MQNNDCVWITQQGIEWERVPMKMPLDFVIATVLWGLLAGIVIAQAPRDQLQQLTIQLQ